MRFRACVTHFPLRLSESFAPVRTVIWSAASVEAVPTTRGMARGFWDRKFKMRQIVALCGISAGRWHGEAFGGKRWRIVPPSRLPTTTFHQQTRVVEHKV